MNMPRYTKDQTYFLFISIFTFLPTIIAQSLDPAIQKELNDKYEHHRTVVSDIYEHIPVLRNLALECASVTEIGMRGMVSSWGILKGLSENPSMIRSYTGIDLNVPPLNTLNTAQKIAHAAGIQFRFIQANDMEIDIESTDLLFIDSLHTYCHLTYELEKFSPHVRKYIALHDTSAPWGNRDEDCYTGNYMEYPAHINRVKRGLWPAVEDFLKNNPAWTLHERRFNNHGFTILKRISN